MRMRRWAFHKKKIAAAAVILLMAAVIIVTIVLPWVTPEKRLDMDFLQGVSISSVLPEKDADRTLPEGEGYAIVADNGVYQLELNQDDVMFRVVEKLTGMVWYGGHPVPEDTEGLLPRNLRIMQNLLSVSYVDGNDSLSSQNSTDRSVTTTFGALKQGFELTFTFPDLQLAVTLQIYLDETGFYARVPDDGLKENGEYRIVSMDILPAFGSLMTGTDGYMVYPDGSGTLYNCAAGTGAEGVYSGYIYAPPAIDLELETQGRGGYKSIPLPYYGSASGKQGAVAYVMDGAEYSRITFATGTSVFGLNRIYTSMEYRRTLNMKSLQDQEVETFSVQRLKSDVCVKYSLLSGEAANYSGMANALRSYLQKCGIFPDSRINAGSPIPLALDILTGAKESGLLGESYVPMSTYADIREMLGTLNKAGVRHINAILLGWQKEGYGVHPPSAGSAPALGTVKTLQNIVNSPAGADTQLFLQTDYVNAGEGGRFSKRGDVVFNFLNEAVTNTARDRFLLNPFIQYQRLINKDMPQYRKLGTSGLAFDGISNWLPGDTAKSRALSATDAKALYTLLTKQAKDSGMKVAVQIGNDYTLRYADYLYDVYDGDSDLFMFSQEIPFYQMVMHGVLPYACAMPGNMSNDYTTQKLKWVEYGSMPYFMVTKKPAEALRDSQISDVFSSRFSDWQELIAATCNEFNERLSAVYPQTVERHEYVADKVVRVTYASGHRVYVNYTQTDVKTEDGIIPARDYAVIHP